MTMPAYQNTATEAQMLQALTDAIELHGGAWYRVRDSRGQMVTGMPDLLCFCPVSPGGYDLGLYGFEVKTMNDRIRPGQKEFLDMLNRVTFCRGEIVRAGRLRDGECTIDDALELIAKGPRA